jgi:hypothetical protein
MTIRMTDRMGIEATFLPSGHSGWHALKGNAVKDLCSDLLEVFL